MPFRVLVCLCPTLLIFPLVFPICVKSAFISLVNLERASVQLFVSEEKEEGGGAEPEDKEAAGGTRRETPAERISLGSDESAPPASPLCFAVCPYPASRVVSQSFRPALLRSVCMRCSAAAPDSPTATADRGERRPSWGAKRGEGTRLDSKGGRGRTEKEERKDNESDDGETATEEGEREASAKA